MLRRHQLTNLGLQQTSALKLVETGDLISGLKGREARINALIVMQFDHLIKRLGFAQRRVKLEQLCMQNLIIPV